MEQQTRPVHGTGDRKRVLAKETKREQQERKNKRRIKRVNGKKAVL